MEELKEVIQFRINEFLVRKKEISTELSSLLNELSKEYFVTLEEVNESVPASWNIKIYNKMVRITETQIREKQKQYSFDSSGNIVNETSRSLRDALKEIILEEIKW